MNDEQALEMTMRTSEIANLIALLVQKGLIAQTDGASYFRELADFARGIEAAAISMDVAAAADIKARRYEDCVVGIQAVTSQQVMIVSRLQADSDPNSTAQWQAVNWSAVSDR